MKKTGKRPKITLITALMLLLGIFYAADAYALDAPHNSENQSNTVYCSKCHYGGSSATPPWSGVTPSGDNTAANLLCTDCHQSANPTNMGSVYADVKTHSSYQTNTTYGTWVIECRTCHNAHYQMQQRAYYPDADSNIVSGGTISGTILVPFSTGTSTVTVSNTLSGDYTNHLLIPNTAYPAYMYRIKSNGTGTIVVYGKVVTTYAKPGSPYLIKYGKMLKEKLPTKQGTKNVLFFNNTGTNSFADADATVDGVCQVCHTNASMQSFRSDGTLEGPDHPSGRTGTDCTECHKHKYGFKADCYACHGYPPLYNTTVQGGLAKYTDNSGTGSNNAGKHQKHVASLGYSCTECHTGYAMPASTTTKTVDIGFENNSLTTGQAYNGQTTVNYQGQNGTAVSKTGARACSNIYCHSNAKAGTTVAAYATVTWLDTAPVLNCNSCHQGPPSNWPSYANGGAGSARANSHPTHVGSNTYGCQKCHNQTTTDGATINTASGKHVNGNIQDVSFEGLNSSGTYSTGFKTCSATYCHGAGPSLAWGSASLACDACHGANNLLQGGHVAHYETGTVAVSRAAATSHTQSQYVFNCGVCHYSTSHATTPVSSNQAANVAFDSTGISGGGTYTAGGSIAGTDRGYNWTAGSCSVTACHGNGLGGGPNATPVWNADLDCKGCHNYTAASGTPMATGRHTAHVNDGTIMTNKGCDACHVLTTSTGTSITDKTLHVNQAKNVGIKDVYDNNGQPADNWSASSCSNVYCHSTGESSPAYKTIAWSATISDCKSCHNYTAASGSAMATGSHTKHITTGKMTPKSCDSCHVSTTSDGASITGPALHVNKTREVTITSNYDNDATPDNNYTPGTKQCSNTYCHSDGTSLSAFTTNVTPTWAVAFGTTCTDCHDGNKAASLQMTSGSHGKHVVSSDMDCKRCHSATTASDSRAISNPENHVNRLVNIDFDSLNNTGLYGGATTTAKTPGSTKLTCSALYCHGTSVTTPTWGNALTQGCGSCHEASSAISSGSQTNNRHYLHYNTTTRATANATGNSSNQNEYIYNCGTCHYSQPHVDGPADAGKGIASQVSISIPWATGYSSGTYSAGSSTLADSKGFGYSSNNKCTSVYCHSDGKPLGASSPSYQTVTWNQTAATPTNCGICHAASPTTNRHAMHTATYGYGCVKCHNSTVSDNSTIANKSIHVDFIKNVNWDSMNSDGANYGSPNCANIYCHSQGKAGSSPYNASGNAPITAASWTGSAFGTNCTDCHRGDSTSGTVMGTTAHTAHVNSIGSVGKNIGCAECHRATVSANRTLSDRTNHVNKLVNIKFDNIVNRNSDNPTYNSLTATVSAGAAVNPNTNANCANVYCHSIGNLSGTNPATNTVVAVSGVSYITITWNTANIDCDDCHGNQAGKIHPVYQTGSAGTNTANSHVKHVESSSLGCDYCHITTVTSTALTPTTVVSNGDHLNRSESVSFKTNGGMTGVYNSDKSCSSTYCHGAGPSVKWGDTTDCASCHGANNNGNLSVSTTAGHAIHYGITTTATSLSQADDFTTGYAYGCNNCHPTGTHAKGPAVTNVRDAEIGGSKLTTTGYTAGGVTYTDAKNFKYTYGTCSTVCHTKDGVTSISTPTWNTAKTSNNCGVCHNKQGDSSPQWSAPHSMHVNTYNANSNYNCGTCHSSTATSNTQINDATGRSQHPNAVKNVSFSSFASGASPTWNSGSQQCSNIYCHGTGQSASPVNGPFTWSGSLGTTCTGCHGGNKATGTSVIVSGSHGKHVESSNHDCKLCHNATTTSDSRTVNDYTKHANKLVDIKFTAPNPSGTYGGATTTSRTPGSAKLTCASLYCHGASNTTPTWGNNGTTYCYSCHNARTQTSTTEDLPGKHSIHYQTSAIATAITATNRSTSGNYIYGCGVCHVSGLINHATGTNGLAANQVAEVKFDTTYAGGLSNGGTYTAGALGGTDPDGYTWTLGTCGNIYCHSAGTKTSTPYVDPIVTNYTWSTTLTCSGCHGAGGPSNTIATYKHTRHVSTPGYGYSCAKCHTQTTSTGTTITDKSRHVNKQTNVDWDATNSDGTAYVDLVTACSNIYCHSQGKATSSPYNASGNSPLTSVTWSGGTFPTDCSGCHGGTATGPTYTNSKANSHVKHVTTTTGVCNLCHAGTTSTGTTITNFANHVDKTYDMLYGGGVSFNIVTVGTPTIPTSCSNITCHGGNSANWGGASLQCSSCHYGANDRDDFTYSGGTGTAALISQAQWTTSGHGRASGTYEGKVNNPAANFPGAAGGSGDPCLYCHDGTVNHGSGTNFYRLRSFVSGTLGTAYNNGVNTPCLICHATGAPGIAAGVVGTGSSAKNATVKIDKYHYGTQHSTTLNGGQLCWDCHDPHGDRTTTDNGPIKMVHIQPYKDSSLTDGKMISATASTVSFLTDSTGASFGSTASPYNGICNVCHTYDTVDPNKMVHYATNTSDSHNSTIVCTQCHKHSADTTYNGDAFKGGGCNGCHDYDTRPANNWGDGFTGQAVEGFGAHKKHIDHIKSRFTVTLDPNTDQFGTGAAAQVCGTCHTNTNTPALHTMTGGGGSRTIDFGGGTYREGGASGFNFQFVTSPTPTYNGISGTLSSVNPKSCSNISCHFQTTPVWQSY